MLRNVDLICRFFNLSTGLVAISPLSLSSHVKPWQKDVHTRVFLNAQGMNKQGIFTICSTACRFALSCADGLTVVHLKMDLAKASSDSKKKVENQDIPGFFLCQLAMFFSDVLTGLRFSVLVLGTGKLLHSVYFLYVILNIQLGYIF